MINQILIDDILAQPDAVSEILPDLRRQLKFLDIDSENIERIMLTGSGDSFYGPSALHSLFLKLLHKPIYPLTALNAASYWDFKPGDLLIAISFSGKANSTIKAVQTAQKNKSKVLAVTGNKNSDLAKISDYILEINWRSPSRNIPHTVDYTTTLLALACVAEKFSSLNLNMLDNLSPILTSAIENNINQSKEIGQLIKNNEMFYFLGAGPNFASAQYGTEKFWEACGIRACAFELEEFAHGPHKLIDKDDPIIILAPDKPSLTMANLLAEGITQLGSLPIIVTNEPIAFDATKVMKIPKIDTDWSPFVVSVPLQLLAWSVATAKGYDVVLGEGRIKNIKKVREVQKSWIR